MLGKPQVNVKNASLARRTDYSAVLAQIIKEGRCPFCEVNLFTHHRKPLLFKTKYWLVTENAWPYKGTKKHFLLIARTHVEKSEELPAHAWEDLGRAYKKLTTVYKLPGASLLMRSGDMERTGATVRHLHAQVMMGVAHGKNTVSINALVAFGTKK